ncbi:Splicing factor 3B subunit 6-like protein [Portunus trituberculatus]|uniref:Splicing factor 3B subunit 6-like protein n=1 Tax=Portunus trituberculatus TaxID=210409 RepID=A0A5B7DPK5_PORTR|nr:Splicing factor 3B subunit 6-like protein [Portunus trituberculatus]
MQNLTETLLRQQGLSLEEVIMQPPPFPASRQPLRSIVEQLTQRNGAVEAEMHNGNTPETRGTAFVVFEDIFDAKNACDHLSGFNVCGRYLVVLYYQSNKAFKKMDAEKKQAELDRVKTKYGINTEELKK